MGRAGDPQGHGPGCLRRCCDRMSDRGHHPPALEVLHKLHAPRLFRSQGHPAYLILESGGQRLVVRQLRIPELGRVMCALHPLGKIGSLQVGPQHPRAPLQLHGGADISQIGPDGLVRLCNGGGAEGGDSILHLGLRHAPVVPRAHAVQPLLPMHVDVHKPGAEEHSAHVLSLPAVIQGRDRAVFKRDRRLLSKRCSVKYAHITDRCHAIPLLSPFRTDCLGVPPGSPLPVRRPAPHFEAAFCSAEVCIPSPL